MHRNSALLAFALFYSDQPYEKNDLVNFDLSGERDFPTICPDRRRTARLLSAYSPQTGDATAARKPRLLERVT
jgi:hypothetical protein